MRSMRKAREPSMSERSIGASQEQRDANELGKAGRRALSMCGPPAPRFQCRVALSDARQMPLPCACRAGWCLRGWKREDGSERSKI